jgi:hypothetical protein
MPHTMLEIFLAATVFALASYFVFRHYVAFSFGTLPETATQPKSHLYKITHLSEIRNDLGQFSKSKQLNLTSITIGDKFVQFVDEDGQVALLLPHYEIIAIEKK